MPYKVNPLSKDELRRLARERLVDHNPQNAAVLSHQEVQSLLEDLAINRIELEIQSEYLQETYAQVKGAHRRGIELYDFGPVACFSTSAQGFITTSNLTGSATLGVERSRLINQSFETFFIESQQPQIRTLMARAIESGESQRGELTLLAQHTQCRYVQLDLNALARSNECQIVLTDITSRWTAENQLREDMTRLEFAMDAAGDCVWDWNLRNGGVHYSRQIKQLYGYELQELGDSIDIWRALVHPDDQSRFVKGVQQYLSGQDTRLSCEVRVRCKDGEHKWILCRAAIYSRTLDGQVDRLIGTHTDITAYR